LTDSVTVLNFFATNCGFCRRQLPVVEKVRTTYGGKSVRFVNISQSMRGRKFTDDQVKANQ
ncbi:MAG: conjugal transfer protein TraF, partial [Bacteroidetes bacterium]|nr:conjugal transfer protein TraF [Bacteroidota bacterium]